MSLLVGQLVFQLVGLPVSWLFSYLSCASKNRRVFITLKSRYGRAQSIVIATKHAVLNG